MHRWLASAFSIETVTSNALGQSIHCEWTAHLPHTTLQACTVIRLHENKIFTLREFFDPRRCPDRKHAL